MMKRYPLALAATMLIWLSVIGCEDTSPVVTAEAEGEQPATESKEPDAGDATAQSAEGQLTSPSNDGNPPEGFIKPPTGDKPGVGPQVGDLKDANPFANEPRYEGPGAQPPANPAGGGTNNNSTYRPAGVGSGKKGRSLENETGIGRMIVTPAVSFFRTRERLAFKVAIPQALQLYKATNGRGPQTHQEFMTKVIQFNKIELPELPAGQRYVYDPKAEQLMVEYPKGAER